MFYTKKTYNYSKRKMRWRYRRKMNWNGSQQGPRRAFWSWLWTFRFHKDQVTSWSTQQLLTFQKRPCLTKLDILNRFFKVFLQILTRHTENRLGLLCAKRCSVTEFRHYYLVSFHLFLSLNSDESQQEGGAEKMENKGECMHRYCALHLNVTDKPQV